MVTHYVRMEDVFNEYNSHLRRLAHLVPLPVFMPLSEVQHSMQKGLHLEYPDSRMSIPGRAAGKGQNPRADTNPPRAQSPVQKSRTGFSVEDILRPDFGRTAIKTKTGSAEDGESEKVSPPSPIRSISPESVNSTDERKSPGAAQRDLPAWVFCTRYSDRPSAGPRSRKKSMKKSNESAADQKRPRTAFNREQLDILTREFDENKYLSEERRKRLSLELKLTESQIKIWFQNKRAKVKKTSSSDESRLANELMRQGLYDHSTVKSSS